MIDCGMKKKHLTVLEEKVDNYVTALKATFTVFLLKIFMRALQKYLYVYTTKVSVQI